LFNHLNVLLIKYFNTNENFIKQSNTLFKTLRPFNDIGFVPTMGGIHKGHISLIKKSIKYSKKTIVSIFINPKQFNNKNDFKSYPSNIKKDLKILKKIKKIDFVYIPKFKDIYKNKKPKNKIKKK
jgi:pantoate--beta-alanine ligase